MLVASMPLTGALGAVVAFWLNPASGLALVPLNRSGAGADRRGLGSGGAAAWTLCHTTGTDDAGPRLIPSMTGISRVGSKPLGGFQYPRDRL